MRKVLLTLGLIAGATPALAADLPMAADTSTSPASAAVPWNGAYVGFDLGYAWGTSTLTFPDTGHFSNLNPSGMFGGVQLGYDWALDDGIVLGARGEFDLGSLDGGKQSISSHVGSQDAEGTMNTFGAVTGRVGYATGGFLPYLTAGWAFGNYSHSIEDIGGNDNKSASAVYSGPTVGAGVEYALSGPWVAGIEYRYTAYGSQNFAANAIDTFHAHTVDLSTSQVNLSLAYHF